jgi:uncharacterized membrane protein YfhO
MKKTILSVMKNVMLLALLLTMGNIYSYSSPVQVSMNIRAQKGQALLRPQVNSIINSHAKKLSGVNFNVTMSDGSWNNEYGYGLVDAYSSVINTPSLVYIQNDTITGTNVISADYIYVGNDVTDRMEHGDVILGQGDITLKAGYIEIKNSTTVPL